MTHDGMTRFCRWSGDGSREVSAVAKEDALWIFAVGLPLFFLAWRFVGPV